MFSALSTINLLDAMVFIVPVVAIIFAIGAVTIFIGKNQLMRALLAISAIFVFVGITWRSLRFSELASGQLSAYTNATELDFAIPYMIAGAFVLSAITLKVITVVRERWASHGVINSSRTHELVDVR